MQPHIGLTDGQRKEIAAGLNKLLANSYLLYLKTHHFHWNVTGPHFSELHSLFESHYTELAEAVDEIAERIRAVGEFAAGSFAQFTKIATVTEESAVPSSDDMLRQLVSDNEEVVRTARQLNPIVEAANDSPTADLLARRMLEHEKNAWMLRSHLE